MAGNLTSYKSEYLEDEDNYYVTLPIKIEKDGLYPWNILDSEWIKEEEEGKE